MVVAFEKPHIRISLDSGVPEPIVYASSLHNSWRAGQAVTLTCRLVAEVPHRCRIDTAMDRWLDGLGTLVVGALGLGFGWYMRRKTTIGVT